MDRNKNMLVCSHFSGNPIFYFFRLLVTWNPIQYGENFSVSPTLAGADQATAQNYLRIMCKMLPNQENVTRFTLMLPDWGKVPYCSGLGFKIQRNCTHTTIYLEHLFQHLFLKYFEQLYIYTFNQLLENIANCKTWEITPSTERTSNSYFNFFCPSNQTIFITFFSQKRHDIKVDDDKCKLRYFTTKFTSFITFQDKRLQKVSTTFVLPTAISIPFGFLNTHKPQTKNLQTTDTHSIRKKLLFYRPIAIKSTTKVNLFCIIPQNIRHWKKM